jgi:hypothetical protein
VGGEIQVDTFTTMTQQYPDVAVHPDGEFTVVWESFSPGGSSFGIQRPGPAVELDVQP